ncbi:unnamed protein product [Thlaspi arvense]|uniref:RING-type E3 ubiquitin transferase n=1 Tax=Thlaspi arvense TaxID=13288 RepID=A0AAU9SQX7_THLAR|nr:unnamed protein product [Thlaspi arvense]
MSSSPFRFSFTEVKGQKIGKGGIECAVCLNEFEDEEPLRWMPPCRHTFHASCIDVWLSSRSTCPVCRADLSLKPGDSFQDPRTDIETGNAQTCVSESQEDDISLMSNRVTWNNNNANYITPRSRSTGLLSSWRIFVPRSRSTGHSLVRFGENLDRFTLQFPEDVSLNLTRRSHMALPQARSSREGYRSGSVVSERGGFSFQAVSVRSTVDSDSGEQSFARLMPEKVMSL